MAEQTVRIEGSVSTAPAVGAVTRVAMVPSLPDSSEYLGGTAVATGTIITIPQGRTWYGYIAASASFHSATQAQAVVGVATTGTGVVPPAAGKIFEIRLSVNTPGTGEATAHETVVTPYFAVYTGSTAATIALNTGAAQDVTAVAYGWLV